LARQDVDVTVSLFLTQTSTLRSVPADRANLFDALMGLLKMIEVVERRRPERTENDDGTIAWEGWILGR
jgi:hypothetical protein